MAAYQRRTRVAAPFDRVWEFYSRVEGLEALTPDWMRMQVEWVRGPDGEADPDVLETGSELRLSVRPFGVGPRQAWTSHIDSREERDGEALFRDTMTDGPFDRWVHTHAFHEVDGATVVDDRVAYELPFGAVGRALGPVAVVGFEPMFRYRHRETRNLLEGDGSEGRNGGGGGERGDEGARDGGEDEDGSADGAVTDEGADGAVTDGGVNVDADADAGRDGSVNGDVDVVDLDHVALRVSDLDAALDFYHGLLDLPTRDHGRFDRGEVPYVAVVAGGRHLHLVPTGEDEEIRPGRDHVCLLLRSDRTDTREELTELLDGLRDAGVTVEADEPRKRYGAYGRDWAAYVRDPDGRIVELKMH